MVDSQPVSRHGRIASKFCTSAAIWSGRRSRRVSQPAPGQRALAAWKPDSAVSWALSTSTPSKSRAMRKRRPAVAIPWRALRLMQLHGPAAGPVD